MTQHSLSDKAWLLKGLIASEAGTLTLKDGRFSFTTDKPVFDSSLAVVPAVSCPWCYFGAGCILKIDGTEYKLSFIQPGNTAGGEYASISDARSKCRRWQAALTHSDSKK